MAYNRKPKEHAFITIERDLKEEGIPAVVLLCGREDYLTEHYRNLLIRRYVHPATRQLDLVTLSPGAVDPQAIEENAETIALMSPRKVICLPDFVDKRGKFPKAFERSTAAFDAMATYLQKLPDGVLLLITAQPPQTTGDYARQSDGKKLKKLQTAVTKAGGRCYDFEALEMNQLQGFVSKRFQAAGKRCSQGAMRRITVESGYGSRYVSYDLFTLENDLAKVIAAAGSKELITEEDLLGILAENPENNVFRMLDAIGRGRKDQALVYLNTLLEEGEAEFGIVANIVKQLELMVTARELHEAGAPRGKQIAYLKKEERTAEFRAKSAAEAAARFPAVQLRSMLRAALEVEAHIKSGLMDGRLALEYFISSV